MLRVLFSFGFVVASATLAANPVFAVTPLEVLASIKAEASGTPGFQGFSAERGEKFYKTKYKDWSCSRCHTDNPAAQGNSL